MLKKIKKYCLWGDEDKVQFDTVDECIEFILEYCNFKLNEAKDEEELMRQTEMMQALLEFYFTTQEWEEEDEEEIERGIREQQEELRERQREYREMQGF